MEDLRGSAICSAAVNCPSSGKSTSTEYLNMPRTKSTTEEEPLTLAALNKILEKHIQPLSAKLDGISATVLQLETRLTKFESEQKDQADSLTFLGDEITDLKEQMVKISGEVNSITGSDTNPTSLMEIINKMEHEKRAKSTEVFGIPYGEGEDLFSAFNAISKKLNLRDFGTDDIDHIYRIKRSKRVVIRFIHTHKRDRLMAAFKGEKLTLRDLGFKTDDRIFVNEVLSGEQYQLLYKARNFKKANNYQYLWTRNQRIYLRKSSDSDVIEIKSEGSLNSL